MPFQKGNNANLSGRPVRAAKTVNETNEGGGEKLQKSIYKFLEKNMLTILGDLETPAGRDKAKIYCSLLNFAVPRLSPRSGEIKFEDMSPKQLSELLKMLQVNALPQVMRR